MKYCTICDCKFTDVHTHIDEKHRKRIVCPSCKQSFRIVAMATKNGKPKLTSCIYCGADLTEKPDINWLEDLKKHYRKYTKEDAYKSLKLSTLEEDNPFWISAKQVLSNKEYKELRLYVYRYGQDVFGYRGFARYTECKRFGKST